MIMIMMLMPIHVGVPWLSFLASLSGSRAQQGYMRSPITELWKFLGFKHCSLHSLSLSYLLLLSPSWTFSRESSTPLPITQTWTLCTHPHQHNHAHPISVCNTFSCVCQKVHLTRLHTAEDTISWYMKWYRHESLKMSFWKEKKNSIVLFLVLVWSLRF